MTEGFKQEAVEEVEIVEIKDEKTKDIEADDFSISRFAGWLISKFGLVTIGLTVIGFFTVHSYLSTFSSLFSYNFNPIQYVGAGTSFIIMLVIACCITIWNYGLVFILFVVLLLLLIATIYTIKLSKRSESISQQVLKDNFIDSFQTYEKITSPLYKFFQWLDKFRILWIFLLVISLGFSYGRVLYSVMPREIGGGMPATIILTFNEEQPLNLWNFAINPEQPRLSEPLQLLIELNDGVLVRQAEGYPAVIVKNHIIDAIQDVSIPMPEPTASPTPSS